MGHIGVARDLKAYVNFHHNKNNALKFPTSKNEIKNKVEEIKIIVLDENACPRYAGAVIKNITVTESPDWLKNKLRTIGAKPINNIVDITNYVMFENGNPLHAFDLGQVGKEIVIRKASLNEQIITLDGLERKLSVEDLLICNSTQPIRSIIC